MFPDDPRKIHTDADLQEVAKQMKIASKQLKDDGGSRAILVPTGILQTSSGLHQSWEMVSLAMTEDDPQWHLSMTRILSPFEMVPVSEKIQNYILDIFFAEWKPIPNPGKMHYVSHFVGKG